MHTIRKFMIAGVGALAVAAVAVPTAAQARWGHHWDGGWGPGFVGGLMAGSALAAPYYYGGPYPYYYSGPYAYDYGPDCYIRRRVYINRFGERIVRHVRVCF
jgi:hypothetical protein